LILKELLKVLQYFKLDLNTIDMKKLSRQVPFHH